MGWFSQVTDFLSSPAFRIGAGVAGLASGAGAFGDMGGWGTALQGLSGAANVAAGAASTFGPNRSALDRATGALQLGLGGYNIGQSAGAVGSFGDVWNQISGGGGGGSSSSAIPGLTDDSGAISGYPGYDESVTRRALPPFPGQPTDPATQSPFNGRAYPLSTVQAPDVPFVEMGDPAAGGGSSARGTGYDISQRDPGVGQADPISLFDPALGAGGGAAPAPAPAPDAAAPGTTQLPVEGVRGQVGGGATTPTPTPTATPPTPTPAAALPDLTGATTHGTTPQARGDWLDRTWQNLLSTAEKNPISAGMAAMQVGSMLTGLFAQSRADIARDAMSQMDPNSPNGAEFRRLYEERARREIEDQAATVRSSLEAKFASRGMLRSTVYTNAVQSLDTARIKLLADLPLTSLNAWNATPQGSGRGLTSAAQYAQATSTPMDFSNMTRVLGQSPFAQQLSANAQRA